MKAFLWAAVVLFVGSYICLDVADPDLWWHIVVGKWILGHHAVPRQDYWNMFGAGQPWRAYSWSNEIVFALIDRWWGDRGLAALQVLLGVALAGSLFAVNGRIARDWFFGALLGLYSTVACFNHFTLRPQVVVWVLFACVIAISDSITERGVTKTRLALLALVGCIWANTHLTAILGLGAIFLWTVECPSPCTRWEQAGKATLAFFVGTLVTPYVGGEWLTFLSKGGHPLKYQMIAEFQPATILQYSTVFVLLQFVFLVMVSFGSRRLPTLSRSALAGGMTIAGLTAIKFLPFAVISLSALMAVWWRDASSTEAEDDFDNLGEGLRLLKARFERLANQTYGAIAFFILCLVIVNVKGVMSSPINLSIVPKKAVDFIEEHKLGHPILNEFGAGGYLMYRFSNDNGTPRYQVSLDGRTNVNPPELWDMYMASFQGRNTWRDYIEAVKPNTILWRQGSPMVSLLFESGEWCRVFASGTEDTDSVVFVRKEYFSSVKAQLTSTNCSGSPESSSAG
jgi:hypothetical protein